MKVLGTSRDTFICEISWDEMYSIVDQSDGEEDYEISAGDEIELTRVIKAAEWIKQLDSEHINRVVKELQMALVGVERVKNTAEALNLFNKLGDKELS